MLRRLLLLLFVGLTVSAAEPTYRLEVGEKAEAPDAVAEPIRTLLAEAPLRLRDGEGRLLAELWIRKQLPGEATEAQVKNGLTYDEIPETTLLGVIRFPNDSQDYRKQRVPAGVYTLRLAFQPQVGDHDGTAPYRSFALALRAEDDRSPQPLEIEKMRERSTRVTEGHPSPWMLFPPGKDVGAAPKLTDKGKGHWVVFWKQDVTVAEKPATLGFGLTLVGVSAAR